MANSANAIGRDAALAQLVVVKPSVQHGLISFEWLIAIITSYMWYIERYSLLHIDRTAHCALHFNNCNEVIMEHSANPAQAPRTAMSSNDYHRLPATEKQIKYARRIAQGAGIPLPWDAQKDRPTLSSWIDQHRELLNRDTPTASSVHSRPTSKQVAFAERLATRYRSDIPRECFQSRALMSKWIDHNK